MNVIASKRILWITAVASLVILPSAGTAWAKSHKAYVCHKGHTISIGKSAVHAHLKHGDSLGRCNSCACDQTFDPVSCADGKTYTNACLAACANASGCAPVCACDQTHDPVSCADGKTYTNACLASCAGASGCSRVCACDQTFDPVSCADGKTYTNACLAACAGQTNCTTPPTLPCAAFPCGGTNRLICHIPPGNPTQAHTLCIGGDAVPPHLMNHGDYCGPCR